MPLNEAASFRRGGLTKQQKKEQEAVLYGLSGESMPQQQFTPEQMLQITAMLEQQKLESTKPKEFDLNNPPKVPYTHQEFPMCVYHHGKGTSRNAQDAEDLAAAIEAGWTRDPNPPKPASETIVAVAPIEDEKPGRRR